jgi:hypothetical protein
VARGTPQLFNAKKSILTELKEKAASMDYFINLTRPGDADFLHLLIKKILNGTLKV